MTTRSSLSSAMTLGALGLLAAAAPAQHRLLDLEAGQVPVPFFGWSALHSPGDVDGDGIADVSVHALAAGLSLSMVSGRTGTTVTQVPSSSERPLLFVDLDGDGILEFVSSTSFYEAGAVTVREGSAQGAVLYTLPIPEGSVSFGGVVEIIGDLDGDGVLDLAIPAPSDRAKVGNQSLIGVGRVFLHSGADGSSLGILEPPTRVSLFGLDVASITDTDGDGIADLAVGARDRAFLFSGATRSFIRPLGTPDFNGRLGSAVGDAGDLNGDGAHEVMVGAPNTWSTSEPGYVLVLDGATGAELMRIDGDNPADSFGNALDGIADVNGDGTPDLVIGAPQARSASQFNGPGYVRIASGVDGSPLLTAWGDNDGDAFGTDVTALGDTNGDGIADFAASFGNAAASQNDAIVRLVSGAPLMLCADVHLASAAAGARQGFEIDAGTNHAGEAYLVLGSMSGVTPGFDVAGRNIPLNIDEWLRLTAAFPGSVYLPGTIGFLDGNGRGTAALELPPLPGMAGLAFDHAVILFDATSITRVSRPVPLSLIP